MPPDPTPIPLARRADVWLAALAQAAGAGSIAKLDGTTLLGERASLNGFAIPGRRSAGGGCRLYDAAGGTIALNLSRPDDRDALPALLRSDEFDVNDDPAIERGVAVLPVADLIERGRLLGMAIADVDETPASPPVSTTMCGPPRQRSGLPLVIDLSALWAGPLAAHLLWLTGAQVVKVESANRPDSMRDGDLALFGLLNQAKASIALDLRGLEGRDALTGLIRRADVVIEAARPRALLQLGIDADVLVREVPGLVWITITGHGIEGDAANWIGFGDDTAIAGGLGSALRNVAGQAGFVGDAIGDPLTGIYAARLAASALASGESVRRVVSMSGVVAEAIREERRDRPAGFSRELAAWAANAGRPFPVAARRPAGPVPLLGADNAAFV